MAGDHDAVHILCVRVVGQELREDLDELVQRRRGLFLDLGRAQVEEDALAEDDVAVAADADLRRVAAHDADHAVADLLKDAQAQHGDGLHLAAHGEQLLAGGLHVLLLLADQRLLVGQQGVLRGQVLLLLR